MLTILFIISMIRSLRGFNDRCIWDCMGLLLYVNFPSHRAIGIRIPLSFPHLSLVQGYGHGHSVVFMVNVRLFIRSLHVWKHSGWVCVCMCPFASCRQSNMKQNHAGSIQHISLLMANPFSPDLTPSSLVLPDVFAKIWASFKNSKNKTRKQCIVVLRATVVGRKTTSPMKTTCERIRRQAATEVSKMLKQVA